MAVGLDELMVRVGQVHPASPRERADKVIARGH
jgi:hypothetical protein